MRRRGFCLKLSKFFFVVINACLRLSSSFFRLRAHVGGRDACGVHRRVCIDRGGVRDTSGRGHRRPAEPGHRPLRRVRTMMPSRASSDPDPSHELPILKCQPKPVRHLTSPKCISPHPSHHQVERGVSRGRRREQRRRRAPLDRLRRTRRHPPRPLDRPGRITINLAKTMRKKRRHAAGVPGQNPLPGAALRRARAAHHDRSGTCERREAGGYSQGGNTHHGTVELVGMEHHPKRQRRTR